MKDPIYAIENGRYWSINTDWCPKPIGWLVKRERSGKNEIWYVLYPNRKRSVRFDISPDVLSGGYSHYLYVRGAYLAAPARLIRDRSMGGLAWYLEYPDAKRKVLCGSSSLFRNVKGERQRIMRELEECSIEAKADSVVISADGDDGSTQTSLNAEVELSFAYK